jgi:pimeloyl-ACP methyl ester carboxylesterase
VAFGIHLKWLVSHYFQLYLKSTSSAPSLPSATTFVPSVIPYEPKRSSEVHFVPLRGLSTAIRVWPEDVAGDTTALEPQTLVLLHGWMDVSASFQFLVDTLPRNWRCISFDWRGFGQSQHSGVDSYWFADYVADLDFFLDAAAERAWIGNDQVNLVAHSMGGNVAMLYAGIRPERIRSLITLEGTGMPATKPTQAPKRYRQWLSELHTPPRLNDYATLGDVAARLQKTNPRLRDDFAQFLASHWAKKAENGRFELTSDAIHKVSNPILYRVEEVIACWREIKAPVLLALASDTNDWHQFIKQPAYQRRLKAIRDVTVVTVPETGHMMHHDQPAALSKLIATFIENAR